MKKFLSECNNWKAFWRTVIQWAAGTIIVHRPRNQMEPWGGCKCRHSRRHATVLVLLPTDFTTVQRKMCSFYVTHRQAHSGNNTWHWVVWSDNWGGPDSWKEKGESGHHKNFFFIILIVIRGRISIFTFYNILLSLDWFIHCLYINNFQIILYMLLGLTFPGQMKQKNEEKGTWLLLSTVSNTVQRNKELLWFVSAGEMPPNQMMGCPFEAYYMTCQGSTICPKQFSTSQPKIITLMWQLTTIISSDLLRCTRKNKKTKTNPRTSTRSSLVLQ